MRRVHVDDASPWHGYVYAYQARRDAALTLVREAVAAGARVLDVGAAQGNFTLALAELGYDVTWNDLRADLAGYVERKRERGVVHYLPGNIFQLGVERPYDAVLATEIIEHVAHPGEFLAELARLTRPGGVIIVTTPNGAYFRHHHPRLSECPDPSVYESVQFKPDADGHIFLLHPDELPGLAAAAGLEVDAVRLFSNPLTAGHLGTERLLRLLPRGCVRACERFTSVLPVPLRGRVSSHVAVRFRRPS